MIDKWKQFNIKETDILQTTEFSEIPKIFWDICIALLFDIFCKIEVFFNFVNQNSKIREFSKIPKKNINLPKYFWNFGKLEVFLEFWKIPPPKKKNWNLIPKYPKSQDFLEFHSRFQKKTWFLKVFYQIFKITLGFFGIFQNSKKPRVFPNSKIPKIFGQIDKFFGILEFWKFRGFLLEFDPITSKNTIVFWEFHNKFQKNTVVFKVFYQNSKKTSSFPKFQKFDDEAYLPKYFWNFGKLEVFLEL